MCARRSVKRQSAPGTIKRLRLSVKHPTCWQNKSGTHTQPKTEKVATARKARFWGCSSDQLGSAHFALNTNSSCLQHTGQWELNTVNGRRFKCAVNRSRWCRALFFYFSSPRLGPARSDRPTTVPGVGGGAGEVGGVGLPESTGGQARIDCLALPATAEGRQGRLALHIKSL